MFIISRVKLYNNLENKGVDIVDTIRRLFEKTQHPKHLDAIRIRINGKKIKFYITYYSLGPRELEKKWQPRYFSGNMY